MGVKAAAEGGTKRVALQEVLVNSEPSAGLVQAKIVP